jgi:hypothetical protein
MESHGPLNLLSVHHGMINSGRTYINVAHGNSASHFYGVEDGRVVVRVLRWCKIVEA